MRPTASLLLAQERRNAHTIRWFKRSQAVDGLFPVRWRKVRDFGPSTLGYQPDDAGYTGRRIDVLGRSMDVLDGEDALAAVRRYLATTPTRTAWYLAQRPVIALHPAPLFGVQVWPVVPQPALA